MAAIPVIKGKSETLLFDLKTPSRTYELKAATIEDRQRWVGAVNAALLAQQTREKERQLAERGAERPLVMTRESTLRLAASPSRKRAIAAAAALADANTLSTTSTVSTTITSTTTTTATTNERSTPQIPPKLTFVQRKEASPQLTFSMLLGSGASSSATMTTTTTTTTMPTTTTTTSSALDATDKLNRLSAMLDLIVNESSDAKLVRQ